MTQEEIKIIKLEEKNKNLKKNAIVLSIFGIVAATSIGIGVGSLLSNNNLSPEMKEFIEFYDFFKKNYYQEVDDRTLLDGMYYGLTGSVNDDYTFYTSTVNNEYQNLLSSGVGLGIARVVYYGKPLITQVMKNSPADKALIYDMNNNNKLDMVGLEKGDIIIKAKNETDQEYYEFNQHHYSEWVNVLTGDNQSTIELIISRDNQEYKAVITRGNYNVDKVEFVSFDNDQAIFKINSFLGTGSETTPGEELDNYFETEIFKSSDYVLDNLIIDLRDNGGGYVDNCNQLLGLFLGKNKVSGFYQYSDGTYARLNTKTTGLSGSYNDRINKYTFIINQNTASAAESFVIGMQDSVETKDKVLVVGETSFGKGIAQTFYEPFDDGSEIRYTFAKVCSPLYRTINKIGIIPDIYADYLSIQDKNQYDVWREYVDKVNDNDQLSAKQKALIKSRVELLLGKTFDTFEESVSNFQKVYDIHESGVFGEKTASKLQDLFYNYYTKNIPINIYDSYVIGSDEHDVYHPTQMKCVKKQISLILNQDFESFNEAVRAFKMEFGLVGDLSLFDLQTSYLLQGKMYDLKVEKEESVLTLAKAAYDL